MITIELLINNQSVKVSKSGSLYHYTFKPTDPKQPIKIKHMGCFGDTEIKQIQLEQGTEATRFTPPSVIESALSGLVKDVRGIKVDLKDSESELWGRITANAKGILADYHENEFKATLALTAKQITEQLEDGEALAQRVMRANIYQTTIKSKDNALESRLTQLQEGFNTKVTNLEKNTSSEIAQLSTGINQRVRNLENKTSSEYTQLSGLIQQKVTRKDVEGIIGNSGDSIYLMIKDKIPDGKMTGNEIKLAINATRDGLKINGENVMIDANTHIARGVIKNAHIGSLDAGKITTGELNSAIVRAIHLDVGNLTGNISNFIQSHWNSINSRISITGNGLTARHTDGSYTVLNASGLYTRIGGTDYQTHYLHDIFNIPEVCNDTKGGSRAGEIGLNSEPYYWYQLPSIYRGKRFKVLASLSDTLTFNSPNYSTGNMRLLRTVCYVQQNMIDYTNARVPIVGYAHVRNIGYGYNYNYPVSVNLFVNY